MKPNLNSLYLSGREKILLGLDQSTLDQSAYAIAMRERFKSQGEKSRDKILAGLKLSKPERHRKRRGRPPTIHALAVFTLLLLSGIAMATPLRPELSSSGLNAAQVSELVKLYTAAADRMAEMVLHPVGGTAAGQEFRQHRAIQQMAQIDQILHRLGVETSVWIGKSLPLAIADGIKRAEKQAEDLGVKVSGDSGLTGGFSLIDPGTVKQFVKSMTRDLGDAASNAGDRAKGLLRKTAQMSLNESDIDRILSGGVIEGRPAETIRKLRDAFRAVGDGTVPVRDKNGDMINFEAGYYASMVARTKTREATVTARHERLQSLDLDLVSIVGLVSTDFCTAFLGQVFSLSGKSSKYPAYSELPGGGPPFHPNCSKSTRAFVEELASPLQLEQADGLDDADKLLGDDVSTAQRKFKDLQIHAQQKDRYASTAKKLFGRAA
jgi:hypothetical protein